MADLTSKAGVDAEIVRLKVITSDDPRDANAAAITANQAAIDALINAVRATPALMDAASRQYIVRLASARGGVGLAGTIPNLTGPHMPAAGSRLTRDQRDHDRVESFWTTVQAGANSASNLETGRAQVVSKFDNEAKLLKAVADALPQLLDTNFIARMKQIVVDGSETELLGMAQHVGASNHLGARIGDRAGGNLGGAVFDLAFANILKIARNKNHGQHEQAKAFIAVSNGVFKRLVQHQRGGYLFLNPAGAGAYSRLAISRDKAYYVHNPGSKRPKAVPIALDGKAALTASHGLTNYEIASVNLALDHGGLKPGYQFVFCMMKHCPRYIAWSYKMNRDKTVKARIATVKQRAMTQIAPERLKHAMRLLRATEEAQRKVGTKKREKFVSQLGFASGCY